MRERLLLQLLRVRDRPDRRLLRHRRRCVRILLAAATALRGRGVHDVHWLLRRSSLPVGDVQSGMRHRWGVLPDMRDGPRVSEREVRLQLGELPDRLLRRQWMRAGYGDLGMRHRGQHVCDLLERRAVHRRHLHLQREFLPERLLRHLRMRAFQPRRLWHRRRRVRQVRARAALLRRSLRRV